MSTLRFDSDYMEGAHPAILSRLGEINLEKNTGYGFDPYSESAKAKIRNACETPGADVFFLSGGTQTNAVAVSALLSPGEGVIAAETGHISVHEAGAIEACGHKVLTLPQTEGKILPNILRGYLDSFHADGTKAHMVQPGMVYISHPTEYGTLYSASEMRELRNICCEYEIPLYLDGARLGYGLMADNTDVTLPIIAGCVDAFYIGGTKVGALFGEALVIPRPGRIKHLFTLVKRQGALLAKGWLLGLQFDILFSNNLYFKISENAVRTAKKLEEGLKKRGYKIFIETPTNQKFIILENSKMREIMKQVSFSVWERLDEDRTVVRFATSWATTDEEVERLFSYI